MIFSGCPVLSLLNHITNFIKVVWINTLMDYKESLVIFLLQIFVFNFLFIRHILSNWCYSILHKISKILIIENNIHLLTPILMILTIQDWKIRWKIPVRMRSHCVMPPKNPNQCSRYQMLELTPILEII